MSHTK